MFVDWPKDILQSTSEFRVKWIFRRCASSVACPLIKDVLPRKILHRKKPELELLQRFVNKSLPWFYTLTTNKYQVCSDSLVVLRLGFKSGSTYRRWHWVLVRYIQSWSITNANVHSLRQEELDRIIDLINVMIRKKSETSKWLSLPGLWRNHSYEPG